MEQDQERDLAATARCEASFDRHIAYGVAVSIAYGLDGLYGYSTADANRELIEAGAARFTPGLRAYTPRTEAENRALWGDR